MSESETDTVFSCCTASRHGGHYASIVLLLSLDAHDHVDDYSGTLGGVRKVHISALCVGRLFLSFLQVKRNKCKTLHTDVSYFLYRIIPA